MEIKLYPSTELRKTADEIENFGTKELEQIAREMFKIMYDCGGIGLAGPQVGLQKRIVVANLEAGSGDKSQEQIFINPRILKRSGEILSNEGCLSLPDLRAEINRYNKLKVEYYDLNEGKHTIDAQELLAILFQHEIDHLDGILIIDRMSMSQRAEVQHMLKEFEDDLKHGKKKQAKYHDPNGF